MLVLGSRNVSLIGFKPSTRREVLRVREDGQQSSTLAEHDVILAKLGMTPSPGRTVLFLERDAASAERYSAARLIVVPNDFEYLVDGDVLAVGTDRPEIRVLYRRNSPHNSFLLTERCNHYCLMCSQPPKDINDDWIVDELLEAIPLIARDSREIGFTGGEPTLLGDRFLQLVRAMRDHLPNTGLHILSNGRTFADPIFTQRYAEIAHPDAMLGIPIYSASSQVHDYIVQADGAFDGTIRGILNLKTYGQQVEIRVVIHKQNFALLPTLAEFIARNLTFVDHVALMGLEMTGFAKANIEDLWIDPFDYKEELYKAASLLEDFGLRTSIYNHQLCTIDERVWHLAVKSISDWKNEYLPKCSRCVVQDRCGGFFATGRLRQSNHITPLFVELAQAPLTLRTTNLRKK